MPVTGDPPVHRSGDPADPGQHDDSTEDRPSLASVDEGSSHRHVSRGLLAVGTDPLHGFFARGLGQAEFVEIDRLPGNDGRTAADTTLDEANAARAEGAISVEDEKRSVHSPSVPAKPTHSDGGTIRFDR